MQWQFDPRHLRTLESIARLGSFSAAATELGYTQSAVSQQLSELERRVHSSVVTRRPVRLTPAGRVLLDAETAISNSMISAAAELSALSDGTTGVVRVGAFSSAACTLAPVALARLRSTHPGVRLALHEMTQPDIHSAVQRGDVDLAITFDYAHAPVAAPRGVRQQRLMDDPIIVVLPAGHALADKAAIDPLDVEAHEWINTSADVGGLTSGATNDASRTVDFEGQDFRTVLNMVSAGLGIALAPSLSFQAPPPGAVARPLAGDGLVRRLYTARVDSNTAPAAVLTLESHLHDVASELTRTYRETIDSRRSVDSETTLRNSYPDPLPQLSAGD
ncbi:LysR family transcriptional regulator [Lacisediminihabitans changchengi]|uniref:LysR family transcriptional regulator n=1 Tax=Lacisediminihabitans changchengi TaxID=2787634 RepID=A0A934SNW3_9MICO|nr:LysR family transcriptional regulator [Lacisediminihabitans changchengi]MBK4348988.1 LysR family transcriptional regulator [Lacisediminihabitans changchengi]